MLKKLHFEYFYTKLIKSNRIFVDDTPVFGKNE